MSPRHSGRDGQGLEVLGVGGYGLGAEFRQVWFALANSFFHLSKSGVGLRAEVF